MRNWSGIVVVAAGLASALLLAAMLRSGRAGALDRPNQRSLHTQPVPRSGGLGILVAVAIGLVAADAPVWLAGSVLVVALVSWLDDQKHMPVGIRFASHFAAAGLVAWGGGLPAAGIVGGFLMLLGIVWMTNLYNFMDGSDGLAGGMALFGFSALAIAAFIVGDRGTATLTGCIAAGAAGFLLFNFPPARIFMGDVGSIPLGFLAAVLGLDGARRELWPLWFPLLAFSPFIVDATLTLLRRALRGDKVWHAHREHYYQRLVRMGWSHRRTALAEYSLMAAMAMLALALRAAPDTMQALGLVLAATLYLGLVIAVDWAWQRSGATREPVR